MKYEEFIKLFNDRMKRYEARFYASIICVPILVGLMSYNGLQKVDIVLTVPLIALAVFFGEGFRQAKKNLDETKRLMFEMEMELENVYVTGTKQRIRVHDKDKCAGEFCSIHNPSDHVMKDFPTHWRGDRRIMERICPCGVGHPDPDDLAFRKEQARLTHNDNYDKGIHGCCGCCMTPTTILNKKEGS